MNIIKVLINFFQKFLENEKVQELLWKILLEIVEVVKKEQANIKQQKTARE